MFVLAYFLQALATVADMALSLYMWAIIIRAILSWVNPDPYNPIVRFLYSITDPLLYRIRRFIPPLGGIDISPIIAIMGIVFLKQFLVRVLLELALRMR